MIQKGQTYHRHDPGGRVILVEVMTDAEAVYQQGLVEKGYQFELLSKKDDTDFDLPDVGPSKPRVHTAPGDSTCISCEG